MIRYSTIPYGVLEQKIEWNGIEQIQKIRYDTLQCNMLPCNVIQYNAILYNLYNVFVFDAKCCPQIHSRASSWMLKLLCFSLSAQVHPQAGPGSPLLRVRHPHVAAGRSQNPRRHLGGRRLRLVPAQPHVCRVRHQLQGRPGGQHEALLRLHAAACRGSTHSHTHTHAEAGMSALHLWLGGKQRYPQRL